jgi:hypothetical protein
MMFFDRLDPFFADTLSFGDGFISMEYAQRDLNAFSRAKSFHISKFSQSSRLIPKTGVDLSKDTLRILKQSSLVSLNDSDHMLPMIDTEIEKGSFEIESISNDPIDETPVTLKHTL